MKDCYLFIFWEFLLFFWRSQNKQICQFSSDNGPIRKGFCFAILQLKLTSGTHVDNAGWARIFHLSESTWGRGSVPGFFHLSKGSVSISCLFWILGSDGWTCLVVCWHQQHALCPMIPCLYHLPNDGKAKPRVTTRSFLHTSRYSRFEGVSLVQGWIFRCAIVKSWEILWVL